MTRLALVVSALLLLAVPASATPVTEVLTGSDGGFSFSVIHSSTGGNDGQSGTVLSNITLGAGGGDAFVVGSNLEISVQLNIGGGVYDAFGVFDLAGLYDNTAQLDQLLGTLTLTSVSGNSAYDGLTFYMEDRNYSSSSMPPNSLNGDTLSLWGATNFNSPFSNPVIGDALDLVPGGTGIDLRLRLANPVPEPGALLAFVTAFVAVELNRRSGPRRARSA